MWAPRGGVGTHGYAVHALTIPPLVRGRAPEPTLAPRPAVARMWVEDGPGPEPLAAPQTRHAGDDLVIIDVLTLNVWGLPWPVAKARRTRFGRILEHLAGTEHHLVGLQELWGRTHRLLRELGPLRPLAGGDSGLALAGDLRPEAPPLSLSFSRGGGPDRLKAKGLIQALVELPLGAELQVVVTHLQAGRRHAAVRAHQVDELLERLAAHPVATVLMGDFNLYSGVAEDEASAARLEAAGFLDAALALGCPAPTYTSANPFVGGRLGRRVAERFDRVLLRSGPRVALAPVEARVLDAGPVLSDHHPLFARLEAREVPA